MAQSEILSAIIKSSDSNKTLLNIFVTPNSTYSKIKGIDTWRNSLSISIKEAAHSGKANSSVCTLLEKELNSQNCQIIKGLKSRLKVVQINNSYDFVYNRISEVLDWIKKLVILPNYILKKYTTKF